jgi:hypothetical protein
MLFSNSDSDKRLEMFLRGLLAFAGRNGVMSQKIEI